MRTRYRITSSVVLAALLLLLVSAFFPPPKQTPVTSGAEAAWNPCTMWVNYGGIHDLMVLVCFGAFLIFIVQGFRNRAGPRWLAFVGVLAIIQIVEDEW